MTESTDSKSTDQEEQFRQKILKKVEHNVNYCYNCNRCVNVCPLAKLNIFSPRRLINDLAFLSLEEALQNNNIWRCLTCGQCSEYCPMTTAKEGVNIPELIIELRKIAKDLDFEKEKIEKCETHEGIFPLIARIQANNPDPPEKLNFLEGTGLQTSKSGEIAYFVGCLPIMEDVIYRFPLNYTNSAKSIIGLLNEANITPVVLNEKCCGHDLLWGQADEENYKKLAEYNVNLYKNAGVKTIIFGCAEGYKTWKYDYPKYIDNMDFEILHFTEFLLNKDIFEHLRFPHELDIKVTYHDACRLGRLGAKLYDPPREIIKKIPGVKLVEMENIREDANCCGVSAFSGCNEFTRILRKNRIEEAVNTGADYLLVSCPKCLTHFNCYLNEPLLEDKPVIRIMDLASFIGEVLFLF
ncbi:MAG: (Fe-S)-binding protein [Promethearchaeota archaeon]|nr:MAG: (Fe-S)-binding protein [Candidatus Lokiarchaeota archaeon]